MSDLRTMFGAEASNDDNKSLKGGGGFGNLD